MNTEDVNFLGPQLHFKESRLFFGDCALDEIGAKYATPVYVYNLDLIRERVEELKSGFGSREHLICFAVKANSSPEILKFLQSLSLGADVVSEGELLAARKAGIAASKIVFSGVAKSHDEIQLGLAEDILSFNVESVGEIRRIRDIAKATRKRPRISIRINPDIDAKTHPKIATGLHATKFGIDLNSAYEAAKWILSDPNLELSGVSCHIGSQILDLAPLREAADSVLSFANSLRSLGHIIKRVDFGGGLGVPYAQSERSLAPTNRAYAEMLREVSATDPAMVLIEPGRSVIAESGVLLTKVLEVKQTGGKDFVLVDAGMNDLIRPAMYDSFHQITPVWKKPSALITNADIVGPVCETGDFFALNRPIAMPLEGELLAIQHTGAYGFSMASNYNLRAKPAEVAIARPGIVKLIRTRETLSSII